MSFPQYPQAYDAGLLGVWGTSPSNVFAVGNAYPEAAGIWHYDGSSWSVSPTAPADSIFQGVWGSSPSDVFAVGSGCIWHYDGSSWSSSPTAPEGDTFLGVWGTSSSDVFAVGCVNAHPSWQCGAGGAVVHYDGSSWSPMAIPPPSY
jgi:hypothetical protein